MWDTIFTEMLCRLTDHALLIYQKTMLFRTPECQVPPFQQRHLESPWEYFPNLNASDERRGRLNPLREHPIRKKQ